MGGIVSHPTIYESGCLMSPIARHIGNEIARLFMVSHGEALTETHLALACAAAAQVALEFSDRERKEVQQPAS